MLKKKVKDICLFFSAIIWKPVDRWDHSGSPRSLNQFFSDSGDPSDYMEPGLKNSVENEGGLAHQMLLVQLSIPAINFSVILKETTHYTDLWLLLVYYIEKFPRHFISYFRNFSCFMNRFLKELEMIYLIHSGMFSLIAALLIGQRK